MHEQLNHLFTDCSSHIHLGSYSQYASAFQQSSILFKFDFLNGKQTTIIANFSASKINNIHIQHLTPVIQWNDTYGQCGNVKATK